MLPNKFLAFGLLCIIPCAAADWTTAQKEWALGTSSVLTRGNNDRDDLLAGADDARGLAGIEHVLGNIWDIHSRQDLGVTMYRLFTDAATKDKIAWNYPRVVSLARWGYAVGYINEAEAWAVIMPTAMKLQHTFSSWQEMGRAYVEARVRFDPELRRKSEWLYRSILMDPSSPWRKYAWDLDLGGDSVATKRAKSAELTVAAHPQGLMCVRVRVPDHIDAGDRAFEPYLKAIAKTVGCEPHVTRTQYDSKDWTLETECNNEDIVHGKQIVARLDIEPIAEQLRNEGVTEMFTYIQHEPSKTFALTPAAQDTWVDQGLQWHVRTLPLNEPVPALILTYGIAPQ